MEQNIIAPIVTIDSFPLCSFPEGSCVTLGCFDGVHLGHQAIFDSLIDISIQYMLPAIIFIITPNPRTLFTGKNIDSITSLEYRYHLILQYAKRKAQGIIPVYCVHLPFTHSLASFSAHDCIQSILIPFCSVKHIILGKNASFGNDRGKSLLESKCSIHYVENVMYSHDTISSTKIRNFIASGDMVSASQCLGRPFSFSGIVVHGCRRGSTLLGFPTANITIPDVLIPEQGVYAVYVTYNGTRYLGVMNIGHNPTFAGTSLSLEVHIIDFNTMIYGEILHIEYYKKLRNEQHFKSVDQLIQQIKQDIAITLEYAQNNV